MFIFLLSSGLFLGWSLGANDAANVFGTAVGSKMLRFKTAAYTCSVFVILGAVISGGGTSSSINHLGSIHTLTGSFLVALSAALSVFLMSKFKLPVSTSQALIGAIIGWNIFAGMPVRAEQLSPFVSAWVFSPILAAICAIVIYLILKKSHVGRGIHLLRLDVYTRLGFVLVCIMGAYTLGANNIANVMGVFISVNPFHSLSIGEVTLLSDIQLLCLVGGLAIAAGIITYSNKVIETVGKNIFRLSPGSGLVVVLASTIVLFLFSSAKLEIFLASHGLPSLPLVPLSSSQSIVGAIIGIAIVKGARGIRYRILAEIALGWVITPIIAGLISLISLYIVQNVFDVKLLAS